MRRLSFLLLYGGILTVVGVLGKVHATYVADPPYEYTGTARFGWSLAYVAALMITAYAFGLPDLTRGPRAVVRAAIAAPLVGALVISTVQLLVGDALLPRFVVLGSALCLAPWYAICASIASGGSSRAESRDLVTSVTTEEDTAALQRDVAHAPEHPCTLVASVCPAEAAGADDALVALVRANGSTVVVLDRDAQGMVPIVDQAALLHEDGVRVRTLSLFYEEWLGKLPLSELERISLMFDIGEVHRARYGRTKRAIDLALGLVGVVPLVLVTPVVVIGNLLANRGPLLYRQERVGRHGVPFTMLKFRTMRPIDDASDEASGGVTTWTAEDDPRITAFGRLLRRTHLDELPQVVNIVRGELSMVGPRPEQPHYVEELTAKNPLYDLRHLVTPGLTGWAQVKYHYGADEDDAMEKLQYEFYYLRHQGFALDVRIMGRTIRSVLRGEGR